MRNDKGPPWRRTIRISGDGLSLSPRRTRQVVLGLMGLMGLQTTLVIADTLLPPPLTRARAASAVVLDHQGQWLRALPVENGRWRIRADLDRTDPAFIKNLLTLEDARFYSHLGVDPLAVVRAAGSNLSAGGIVSGASTLSMQTARLLEPRPRNAGAKIIEAIRAVQLEWRMRKRTILSTYLTLAPYGGNLEGVRAASLSYFGQEPESLTLSQQALLIALPQSPEARRPDRHPEAARQARRTVLDRLVAAGRIRPQDRDEADQDPLPGLRAPFPALAWHATGPLAAAASPEQPTVISTLDRPLQSQIEALAEARAKAQGPETSVAVMVVSLKDRAVRVRIGSAGRDRPGGWVDMTRVLRSPGSTLKPFIYGFAFEAGLAAPDTRLTDAPTRFGDYQPENFERVFHGQVTAREALMHSLNVPAVAVLNRIGPESFQARLEGADVRLIRPKSDLRDAGLALALGGAGLSLEDLTRLYAALGDEGRDKPLARTVAEAQANLKVSGHRFMQAEAARQVVAILSETPAPAGRAPGALLRQGIRPAYKTGTSYGFRDALAVGIAGGHVVAVWTGRPDGGARGGLTGRDAAAPLLFDIFDVLATPSAVPQVLGPKSAPAALQTFNQDTERLTLIFPPDRASLMVETLGPTGRGLVLSARGKGLNWYVDGQPLMAGPDGRTVWHPETEGFFDVRVTDETGQSVTSRVRVRTR